MKKTVLMILSLLIAVTMLTAPAFADPWKDNPGNSKDNVKWEKQLQKDQKQAAKAMFKDINKHWAMYDIEKVRNMGLIKGYPDGTFKPNSSITSAEAVAIAIRITDNLYKDIDLSNIKYADLSRVPEWARGSVGKAYALKMINLNRFHSHVQASRADVAVMLAKALKLKPIDVYNISIKDRKLISNEDLGYILALYKIGIIRGGSNGNFNPNNCISRAELAAILSRIVDYLEDREPGEDKDEVDKSELAGVITRLVNDKDREENWKIKLGGDIYKVDEDVDVYNEYGKSIEFSDLEKDDVVIVYLENDEVEKIEVLKTLSGEVIDIDEDDDQITIEYDNNKDAIFNVADDVVIKNKEGYKLDFDDLRDGWDVELKFSDGEVVKIIVNERIKLSKTYQGIINDLDNDEIKVGSKEFDLVPDFDIEDYLIGSKVKVYVFNDEVHKIEVLNDKNYITVPGEVTDIDDDDWEITIKQDSGNTFNFGVYKSVRIDEGVDFDEIKDGWDVELKLYKGKVYEIDVK